MEAEIGGSQFKVSMHKKKLARACPQKNKVCIVAYFCNPSEVGGIGRRIIV
jgi:hypothetical protein